MSNVARAFDEHGSGNVIRSISLGPEEVELPWGRLRDDELPPLLFQLRLRDGTTICYPYSDVREVRCLNAGNIQIVVVGLEPLLITVAGRHLYDLADLFSRAAVTWVREADSRDLGKPESMPEIVGISVQTLPK
jgi:hypothetical protein